MDLRPSIHIRTSERLYNSPGTDQNPTPKRERFRIVKGRKRGAQRSHAGSDKNRTPKPRGFFEKSAKIISTQSKSIPNYL